MGGRLKEETGGGAEEIGFVAGCCGRRFVDPERETRLREERLCLSSSQWG